MSLYYIAVFRSRGNKNWMNVHEPDKTVLSLTEQPLEVRVEVEEKVWEKKEKKSKAATEQKIGRMSQGSNKAQNLKY